MSQYEIFDAIASGGMGTVHYGRATNGAGLRRVVAVKRMHGDLAQSPTCLAMFRDELRLATRVRHPNVVATLDMVEQDGELLLVLDYVQGVSLQDLIARVGIAGQRVPPSVAVAIVCGILQGLEAAHEATNEAGEPLGIVHRDVSPENILVGRDGIARLLDFGIASGAGRKYVTRVGEIKGKPSYLAPEQIILGGPRVGRRVDIYGAAIVLWEALTGRRLFDGESATVTLSRVLNDVVPPPSSLVGSLPPGLDEIVLRGLSRDPEQRYATALDMARALSAVCGSLLPFEVAEWVELTAADALERQARYVTQLECRETARERATPRAELPLEAEQAPSESTHTTMVLTRRSTPAHPSLAARAAGLLQRTPRLKPALVAVAVASFCFLCGVVVVGAAVARPRAAARPATLPVQPPKPAISSAVVPVVPALPTPSATLVLPLPSAAAARATVTKPKKKQTLPQLTPRKPIIDDGF